MSTDYPLPPEVAAMRGREYHWHAPEEVGRASIRLFAIAINHRDPLFYDEEYAKESFYGGVVAPPTFVCETWQYGACDLAQSGVPLDRANMSLGPMIRTGNEYELFQVLRPTDVLDVRMRISDIYAREEEVGTRFFSELSYDYINQHGILLARHREFGATPVDGGHPTAGESHASPPSKVSTPRSRHPIYFEDVAAGDQLHTFQETPSEIDMVRYSAATWDFSRLHYDQEYARSVWGLPAVFLDPQMQGSYMARLLGEWAGTPCCIKKMNVRYLKLVFPGETLVCNGHVSRTYTDGDQHLVECDVYLAIQRDHRITATSKAIVALPSRTGT